MHTSIAFGRAAACGHYFGRRIFDRKLVTNAKSDPCRRAIRHAVYALAILLSVASPALLAQLSTADNRLMVAGSGGIEFALPDVRGFFGRVLTVGDFNCDGFADAAIGSPQVTINGFDRAGQVIVLYGSVNGLRENAGIGLSQRSANVPGAAEANDEFGSTLAAGKLSSDACDDLAVGVPLEDLGTAVDAGSVIAFFGASTGITGSGSLALPKDTETGDDGPQAGDNFGSALAIGNILSISQSFDELIIGVPNDSPGFLQANGGSIDVRRGSGTPLLGRAGRRFQFDCCTGAAQSNEGENRYGQALTTGDFDDDGLQDLVIGVPFDDIDGVEDAGSVIVQYGSGSPLGPGGSLIFHQNSSGIPGINETDDRFGSVLASGDFDGDGDDDLVIGTPHESVSGHVGAGMIMIRNGRQGGVNGFDSTSAITAHEAGLPIETSSTGFGGALAVGDFNDDGFDDLAAGATDIDIDGALGAGIVIVFYGASTGISASRREHWHQNIAGVASTAQSRDFFGSALTAGDFNGDGVDDLLVAVPGEKNGGVVSGGVHVFYGRRPVIVDPIFKNGFE